MSLLRNIRLHYWAGGPYAVALAAFGKLVGSPQLLAVADERLRHGALIRVPSVDVYTLEEIVGREDYGVALDPAPAVVVDAGANIGLSAAYFASRWPSAVVYSIEPQAANYRMLQSTAERYEHIRTFRSALAASPGEVVVEDPGLGSWGFRTRKPSASRSSLAGEETVPATTIRDLIEEHAIDRIDLLKMDIEGAELEVLERSGDWIDKVDVLMVELHERFRPGCTAAYENAVASFPYHYDRPPLRIASRRPVSFERQP